MRKRLSALAVLAGIAGAVGAVLAAPVGAHTPSTYEVTIANLTSGQPLTPPVVATHKRPVHVFEVGSGATFGVKEIAENGNNAPLLSALEGDPFVTASMQAGAGPVLAGTSVSFSISGSSAAKYLSFAAMLICTNDGFTGIDGIRLPKKAGQTVVAYTNAYDAGTELNTEDFADIVPPCPVLTGVPSSDPGTGTSNPALAEGGVIHMHAGIAGIADLVPGVHNWTNPVARITITAVS